MEEPYSIVSYRGHKEFYRCGYCRTYGKVSDGMWAHRLTVQDYQDLIDRGWRRSGKYCYKPAMDKTCCPQYTIKCTASDFKMNKSHKKAIKRFNRFINTGHGRPEAGKPADVEEGEGVDISDVPAERMSCDVANDVTMTDIDTSRLQESAPATSAAGLSNPHNMLSGDSSSSSAGDGQDDMQTTESTTADKSEPPVAKKLPKPGLGADPNRPLCQKAKDRRREKWRQKHGISDEPQANMNKSNESKTLEQLLQEIEDNSKHKFEVRLVRSAPRSKAFQDTFDESYTVYKKYQMAIHGDPPDKPTKRQYTSFLVDSPLEVRLVRSAPRSVEFNSTLDESYNVYRRYQMSVHHDKPDDCDRDSYMSFLVNSPLEEYYHEGGFPDGFGSFHQHYLIDGKIVAVGVIDILPYCISSVYLYYDPDFFFLSLGTYSALQELAFTRHLQQSEPSLKHYYMGFYIHSCPKMRYKGQYVPSFLLCPQTYNWLPIETCRPKLDANKYSRLEDDPDAKDAQSDVTLGTVLVLYERQAMPYQFYTMLNPDTGDEEEVLEYAGFVGHEVATRMLLFRS